MNGDLTPQEPLERAESLNNILKRNAELEAFAGRVARRSPWVRAGVGVVALIGVLTLTFAIRVFVYVQDVRNLSTTSEQARERADCIRNVTNEKLELIGDGTDLLNEFVLVTTIGRGAGPDPTAEQVTDYVMRVQTQQFLVAKNKKALQRIKVGSLCPPV